MMKNVQNLLQKKPPRRKGVSEYFFNWNSVEAIIIPNLFAVLITRHTP